MTASNKPSTKAADATKKVDPNALQLIGKEADRDKLLAQTVLRPSVQAAATLQKWSAIGGELNLMALIEELSGQAKAVNGGDLVRAEGILAIQAHTLDAIFNNLARRAALNAGEYLGACETYLRLALKAQSQCRATIETLATIKNPAPVAFVRQANIAHGPQQVNNGVKPEFPDQYAHARAHTGEIQNQPNELLEQTHGKRLDPRTTGPAIGTNSPMETVGAVNRAEDLRR